MNAQRISMEGSPERIEMYAFSNERGQGLRLAIQFRIEPASDIEKWLFFHCKLKSNMCMFYNYRQIADGNLVPWALFPTFELCFTFSFGKNHIMLYN